MKFFKFFFFFSLYASLNIAFADPIEEWLTSKEPSLESMSVEKLYKEFRKNSSLGVLEDQAIKEFDTRINPFNKYKDLLSRDKNTNSRLKFLWLLAKTQYVDISIYKELPRLFNDENELIRNMSVWAFKNINLKLQNEYLNFLSSTNPEIRQKTLKKFKSINPRELMVKNGVLRLLQHFDPGILIGALELIEHFKIYDDIPLNYLENLATHPDFNVKIKTVRLLSQVTKSNPDINQTLKSFLKDPDPKIRQEAILAFQTADKDIKQAVKALLKDKNEEVSFIARHFLSSNQIDLRDPKNQLQIIRQISSSKNHKYLRGLDALFEKIVPFRIYDIEVQRALLNILQRINTEQNNIKNTYRLKMEELVNEMEEKPAVYRIDSAKWRDKAFFQNRAFLIEKQEYITLLLENIQPLDLKIEGELILMLHNKDNSYLRHSAVRILGKIKSSDPELPSILTPLLLDEDKDVYNEVLLALAENLPLKTSAQNLFHDIGQLQKKRTGLKGNTENMVVQKLGARMYKMWLDVVMKSQPDLLSYSTLQFFYNMDNKLRPSFINEIQFLHSKNSLGNHLENLMYKIEKPSNCLHSFKSSVE